MPVTLNFCFILTSPRLSQRFSQYLLQRLYQLVNLLRPLRVAPGVLHAALEMVGGERAVKQKFTVTGMTCSACSAHVDKAVRKLDGVCEVNVNLLGGSMTVDWDGGLTADPTAIRESMLGERCQRVLKPTR